MKISIVIPCWNSKKQLEDNIPFVLSDRPDEIIVVDDASEDSSVHFLKEKYPQIKIIQNQYNKNFAFTVNRGVSQAKHELICILNADVRPHKNYLKNAIKYFKDQNVFGVTLHELGNGPSISDFRRGFIGYKKGKEKAMLGKSFWLSGGSCIVRKNIWEKLNGFDAQLFPFYWEDLDISYRAAKRGFELLWIPDSVVEHRHETYYKQKYTAEYLSLQKEVRQLLFIWKNLTDGSLFILHILGLLARVIKSPGYIKIVLLAMRKIPSVYQKRKIEIKESKISDKLVLEAASGKGQQ